MVHGDDHWRRVARIGLRLSGLVPGVDAELVVLFAALHDTQRVDDGYDQEHGPRAARVLLDLNGRTIRLGPARLGVLHAAVEQHTVTRAPIADDPTAAVCLDADRLQLWRVGVRPDPRYLATAQARRLITWAERVEAEAPPSWDDLLTAYDGLRGEPPSGGPPRVLSG